MKFSIFFFFNFRHCISQSKVSIWLYFDILLLAEIFFFFICFLFVVAPQSIFMMALKPLSDYFNVSYLGLASIDCVYSFSLSYSFWHDF